MRITPQMRALESRYGKPINDVLIDVYNNHGSLRSAADELGVDFTTLSRWMWALGIEIRTQATAPGKEAVSADTTAA